MLTPSPTPRPKGAQSRHANSQRCLSYAKLGRREHVRAVPGIILGMIILGIVPGIIPGIVPRIGRPANWWGVAVLGRSPREWSGCANHRDIHSAPTRRS